MFTIVKHAYILVLFNCDHEYSNQNSRHFKLALLEICILNKARFFLISDLILINSCLQVLH